MNEEITISIYVENIGEIYASNVSIELFIGGSSGESSLANYNCPIEAGEVKSFTTQWRNDEVGSYVVYVRVAHIAGRHEVEEVNFENNVALKEVKVVNEDEERSIYINETGMMFMGVGFGAIIGIAAVWLVLRQRYLTSLFERSLKELS